MAIKHSISCRMDEEEMAVLRKLGQLSNVSADAVARRLLVDLMPWLEEILVEAEQLVREEDPAGRGYITWQLHFPQSPSDLPADVAIKNPNGVTLQPSGGLLALNVGGRQVLAGTLLEVSDSGVRSSRGPNGEQYGMWVSKPRSGVSVFSNLGPLTEDYAEVAP